MPFEVGHTINAGRGMLRRGPQRERRRGLRLLAMEIREDPRHAGIVEKLYTMADGKDPVSGERISVAEQREAIKLLLLYGHGQPAQHVVLEGAIRSIIDVEPRGERPDMTLDEINARRAALRAAGVVPKVIDVAPSLEVPLLGSGDDGE